MRERFKSLKLAADIFPFLWTKEEKIRSLFVISFGLIFIAIGLDLSIPFILKKVVSSLSDSDKGMTYEISLLLVAYGGIWTLSQTIQQARLLIMVRPLERCIQIFCSKLFNHLHTLPMRFHLNRKTGAITNALERAQHGFPDVFCGLFLFVIPTLIELLLAVLILSYCYGAAYGLILLFIFSFFLVFILYSTEWAAHFQTLSNEKQSEANANIVDSLLNYASVKYFNNKDHETLKCNHHLKEREKLLVKSISSMEFVRIGQSIIIGLGLILLTYMAGRQALSSGYDISDFVLINGYILQFVSPLSHLGFIANEIRKGINDLANAIEIYKNKPMPSSQAKEFPLKGRLEKVEFKKVSFGYDENRPILKEVSFCLQAGQTLGIVGTTGAGKSTISNLLFKFYDVKSGKILINDENIQKLNSDSLYGHLGVVPQDIVLFNTSIYENILFARPNAHKREVEEVIELAHLESVLKKLPNHLNTIVGERGLKLSGGEKQRIAIARVLLKQPALYIFDEATSSLDLSTEEIIMNNIAPVIKNSTSIIIAHRLSTILNTDKIIVLHDGYVAEQGTHTTLLKKNGIYAELWMSHEKAHKRPSAA